MNETLNELRPRMMSVAYRILGNVADAEDAVQDAYLRLQKANDVTSPEGFLVRTTTRRCIDQTRMDRRRRSYVGSWGSERVDCPMSIKNKSRGESLSHCFLFMLQRLSPNELAAFVLRTVFDYEYSEIAEVLEKSETCVRQIVSRAKNHLAGSGSRFRPAPDIADRLAERFEAACRDGSMKLVEQLLIGDVKVCSDGGSNVLAAIVLTRETQPRCLVVGRRIRRAEARSREALSSGEWRSAKCLSPKRRCCSRRVRARRGAS